MIFKLHLLIVDSLSRSVFSMASVLACPMACDHKVGNRNSKDQVKKRMAHKVFDRLLADGLAEGPNERLDLVEVALKLLGARLRISLLVLGVHDTEILIRVLCLYLFDLLRYHLYERFRVLVFECFDVSLKRLEEVAALLVYDALSISSLFKELDELSADAPLKLGLALKNHSGRQRAHSLDLFGLGAFAPLGHVMSEDVVLQL